MSHFLKNPYNQLEWNITSSWYDEYGDEFRSRTPESETKIREHRGKRSISPKLFRFLGLNSDDDLIQYDSLSSYRMVKSINEEVFENNNLFIENLKKDQ